MPSQKNTSTRVNAKDMVLKCLLLTSVILLGYLSFYGQSGFPYESEWKLIDLLLNKKNLPKSALAEVNKVWAAAKKDKNEPQWVKAIIYQNQLLSFEDRNINQVVTGFEKEIFSAPPRVAALLYSIESEQLNQYLEGEHYRIQSRTDLAADTSADITTWTINRLNQRIRSLYFSSLNNPVLLQRTPVENFNPILDKGKNRDLRPTLYDLLSWRALDYFQTNLRDGSQDSGDSLLQNSFLFADALFFMHYGFSDSDSNSNFIQAIRIYQQVLRFHAKDIPVDAYIDADIKRIQFLYQYAEMPDKDSLYMNALGRITRQYPSLAISSLAWFLQAQWLADRAGKYNAQGDSTGRFDYLKALAICQQAIIHPDSSEGKSNCENLIKSIHKQSFNLTIEQVNIPEQPFRVLATYKNITRLYGRIIRIDDATKGLFDRNSESSKSWIKWIHLAYKKSFLQPLPETGDFQEHGVEFKIDALPPGQYALLTSSDSVFSDQAIMGLTTFFCSGIAYMANQDDIFVLDRDSGHPLAGVKVKMFNETYHNGESRFTYIKTYQSDVHGYFHLTSAPRYSTQKLEFYLGEDYFSTVYYMNYYWNNDFEEQNVNHWNETTYEKKKLRDNLFTDRSIYRPGRTVFFKGLLITRDFKTGKYKAVTKRDTKIFLVNVNNQKIDSLILKSNDFGSFQGSFHLPQNELNGEFKIQDATTREWQSFSVEEYKRPSFCVEYDSLKGSYKIGDSIILTGSALAYSGSHIEGARFTCRVVRESRFPYPWLFRVYPSNPETEIAHGESLTDQDGKFMIRFIAVADKTISQTTKPVYTYRVETTVTDGNGESRSATTSVSASYQSFEISSSLPDLGSISKDSLYRIPLTTQNSSGYFLKEELTLSVYSLQGPDRLIRKRYWPQPDQYLMSESEYIHSFPNDEYRDETNIRSWKQIAKVFEITDTTSESGWLVPDKKGLTTVAPGWYLFEFKARDKDGQDIVDKKYVEITGSNPNPVAPAYNRIPEENALTEPGKIINIHTGSDARDLFVIRIKNTVADSAKKYSFYNLSQGIKTSPVEITEADRGGFAFNDVFVKNNRWYTSEHNVQVPWTNKELQISYLTWKDKTLPGSPENWKIKISGYRKDQVSAEILTSMYDASLDQFKMHNWAPPDIYPVYNKSNSWNDRKNFNEMNTFIRPEINSSEEVFYRNSYDEIIDVELEKAPRAFYMVTGAKIGSENMLGHKDDLVELGATKIVKDSQAQAEAKPPTTDKPKDSQAQAEAKPPTTDKPKSAGDEQNVQIRKNFNETAFFQPDLKTDAQGNVEISFNMPDALTKWKWMVLANTKDLAYGYAEKMIVTQKELMVQTNMPRFFREGDSLRLPVKIANLSSQTMTGTVRLEWLNAGNNQSEDQPVGNLNTTQPFTVNASQSGVVFFSTNIPAHFNQPLLYRVIAKTDGKGADYSDGEENIIPVLSNRMLVTESLPINMNGKDQEHFVFEKLLKSNTSGTLQNQSLTVEYSTNPAWYAIQSLPYLMEFPYECAEQSFNRFYANSLATHIVQVTPGFRAVLEKWKNTDTAALVSNLQKNEELKSALLRETPWVLEAQSETQQNKNLALLFDVLKMQNSLKSTLNKLQQMQLEEGGFAWFKGGRPDRYITQYIVSGIGRLRKLKAIPPDLQTSLDKMARSGIAFLDKEINTDFKRDTAGKMADIEPIQIHYLYMRSFFPDEPVPGSVFNALNYFRKQAIAKWMNQSVCMQGMIALYLNRTGDIKTSKDILASLSENATVSAELGMYWKSVVHGYYWQEAPVETQSLLIETFQELQGDIKKTDQMKYWLLQQKHTSHWPTTKATADACYALLVNGSDWISSPQAVSIQLGNYRINSPEEKTEAGTGYFKKQIPGNEVVAEMGNIEVTVNGQRSTINDLPPTANRQPSTFNRQPSWGAVYWQYFENLDKIPSANTQLSVTKNLYLERNSDKGPILEAVSASDKLKPGDKLKMRIILKTDRDLEYVHLKDMRAACLEPVNVLSGYRWQDGLGYYETTQDASTSFFFDRLPRGSYVFEYPVFVTTAGNFSNGISTLQCMYAPEFAAHSEGIRIQIESK